MASPARERGLNVTGIGAALYECLVAGLLCNESRLIQKEGQWGIEGDPTEAALITAALKAGLSEADVNQAARLSRPILVLPWVWSAPKSQKSGRHGVDQR